MKRYWKVPLGGACLLYAISACGAPARPERASTSPRATSPNAAQPLPAETHPPGDIPDTQAFVTYASPSGYSVSFPEGWQRTAQARAVTFLQGFDGERVRLDKSMKFSAQLATAGSQAVRDVHTSSVSLLAGKATLVTFTSNSQPSSVTGKAVRLENNTYVITSPRGTALVDLWAPLGSDNVDQWRRISRSFKWR